MRSFGVVDVRAAAPAWFRDHRVLLAVYTATIFLSALLLFAVQPLFARIVLPSLGGSPSVWAVTMVFFQGMLLAGYGYAFALNRLLSPPHAVVAHVALLAAAALALPVALPAGAGEPPASGITLWLLGVLAAGVGLPFFALAANAPLLQSWFGRTAHPDAADPYFLYAASNIGSLVALLAYPVAVEPALRLATQGTLWSGLFFILGLAIAGSGLLMIVNRAPRTVSDHAVDDTLGRPVTAALRLSWVALAFVPSALLVAFTTYVSTDIASAPLLWVVPLAVFLLTFTMVFRERPAIPHTALVERQPMLAALAIFATPAAGQLPFGIGYIGSAAAFLVTCLVCHRELYERRPGKGRLTEFYMWMSLGGVLGGVFAALISPLLFSTVVEFPLLLAASVLLRPQILIGGGGSRWVRAGMVLAAGVALLLAVRWLIGAGMVPASTRLYLILVAAPFALLALGRHDARLESAGVALMASAVLLVPADGASSHAVRSFFGVHRIVEDEGFRLLKHGTTVHGAQRLAPAGERPVPATYYHPNGPMARAASLVRGAGAPPSFAVIGLGSGAMACNAGRAETWTFYEIDQAVVDIARSRFGYMASCLPDARIVVGDARLTLAREPRAAFDLLLVDAFSSDSIPTHLLTVEAARLYLEKLAPGGVLAFHLSNRHLDLAPIVAANAEAVGGLSAIVVRDEPGSPGYAAAPSTVVLISRDAARLAPALAWSGSMRLTATGSRAWTDDYSDIFSALVRGLMR